MSSVPVTEVTRRIEFDAGHRVPSHKGLCRNPHGHRYAVEVTLQGPVQKVRGESDDGMVLDFRVIKDVLQTEVHDIFDHGFLVFQYDKPMLAAFDAFDKEAGFRPKVIVLPYVPTAENISSALFHRLDAAFAHAFQKAELSLVRVRVYETPTCSADTIRA